MWSYNRLFLNNKYNILSPNRSWGPLRLLYNEYSLSLSWRKSAGVWRWPPTPIYSRGWRKNTATTLYSLWAFMAFSRLKFTFAIFWNSLLCNFLQVMGRHSHVNTTLRLKTYFSFMRIKMPILVAARLFACWDYGVRILPAARKSVSCDYCVLSGRGLCVGSISRPEEFYRVWSAWVWSWSLDNEQGLAHWGLLHDGKRKKLKYATSRKFCHMKSTDFTEIVSRLIFFLRNVDFIKILTFM